MSIVLEVRAVELEGVTVESERSRLRARFEEAAGTTVQTLAKTDLKTIPGIAEADPVRAAEVLPGVTTVSDFTSSFNVRGGSTDQNLILLDGIPIFNPFHLAASSRCFNTDMVQRAELMSGGFSGRVRRACVVRPRNRVGPGRRRTGRGCRSEFAGIARGRERVPAGERCGRTTLGQRSLACFCAPLLLRCARTAVGELPRTI